MSAGTGALLAAMLSLAVPQRIEAVRAWPEAEIARRRAAALDLIANQGDALFYPVPATKATAGTRAVFAAVVDALAILSFAPGGVEFVGVRFCARHGGLVRRSTPEDRWCAQCHAEGL